MVAKEFGNKTLLVSLYEFKPDWFPINCVFPIIDVLKFATSLFSSQAYKFSGLLITGFDADVFKC